MSCNNIELFKNHINLELLEKVTDGISIYELFRFRKICEVANYLCIPTSLTINFIKAIKDSAFDTNDLDNILENNVTVDIRIIPTEQPDLVEINYYITLKNLAEQYIFN